MEKFKDTVAKKDMSKDGVRKKEGTQEKEHKLQIATRNNDLESEIAVHEGDILLRRGQRSAINCESCLWPKSQDGLVKVPVNISSDFSLTERSWIADALQEVSTLTCVKFVNRTTETDYVYVEHGQSCWSYFGKIGGRQAVGLMKNGCMDKGAIQHEMNHALGFIHEQARSDRDKFVKIVWEHIMAGEQGNFGKVKSKNLGLPYDYSSVMHYGAYDFSSAPGKPTIVPIPNPSVPIGQREGLSNLDVAKINKLYKCNCCSSVLPKPKGSFSSVNYPSPYPNNSNCLWLIRIRRSKIFLQFETFDLQTSSDCSSDYIKVYNGNSKNSPVLLDKYCGKGPLPSVVASGSTMLVEFATDETVTATGFRASYSRVNCGDTFRDSNGVITSPNYPNKYPKNRACFWVISSPVGYKCFYCIFSRYLLKCYSLSWKLMTDVSTTICSYMMEANLHHLQLALTVGQRRLQTSLPLGILCWLNFTVMQFGSCLDSR
ncbi:astacin-like metalloendopeptidase isoform X1 [Anas acuta]|uniref:astacin-like metalloendopeptidase isoform X1 n=2 Tax=Anas acuta TaxID=28680 RepID=UPI0035C8D4C7